MDRGLTIGIDGRDLFADKLTGMGRCVLNLLEHVSRAPRAPRYLVFCHQNNTVELPEPVSSVEVVTIPEGNRLWWDQVQLPRALRRAGVDVFFSPYPKLPVWTSVPCVHMIADVIPLTWPAYQKPWSLRTSRALYRFWSSRARRTVALTHYAKDSLVQELSLDPNRIAVIPGRISRRLFDQPSADEVRAVRQTYDLPERFCLYVGSAAPHKNVGGLVEAFATLPAEVRAAYPLVLAGFGGGGAERWLGGLDPAVRSTVHSLGEVTDEALHVLYHEATLFVFPSLAEGFGYPPLEAMACGTPVIAVRAGPMPEVLGQAPYWVETGEPIPLAQAMMALLQSESQRRTLSEAGRKQAERYATTASTELLLDCLEAAWAGGRARRR
jgi:glycosyltransferase involved in cell wall biosynthesis